jgi:hypothetical protein
MAEVQAATPLMGVERYFKVVLNAIGVAPTLGCLLGMTRKDLNLFLVIEEVQYREDGVFASNTKGKRELKKLECFINIEARGSSYSRGKVAKVGL